MSLDFEGPATVAGVAQEWVEMVPVGQGEGGPAINVPLSAFERAPKEGQVLDVTILEVDSTVLLESRGLIGQAQRVSLRRTKLGYEVKGHKGVTVPFPESVSDQQARDFVGKLPYWLFAALIGGLPGLLGHFQHLEKGLSELGEKRAAADHASAEAALRRSFINPYNFVPLPTEPPEREHPPGHARRKPKLLHGRIDFTLRAKSPILIRDAGNAPDGTAVGLPRHGDQVVIPGSSFKGALRSAFEAVTGSCLRVVDDGFVPGYRDVLRANNRHGWSLIEVVAVDRELRPTQVRVCTDPVWFSFPVLRSALGAAGVKSGARLELLSGGKSSVGSAGTLRYEVRDATKVARVGAGFGDEYLILVTDVKARPSDKGVCFVGGRVPSGVTSVEIDSGGWARFVAALDGCADMKRGLGASARKDEVRIDIHKKAPSDGFAYRQLQGLMVGDKPTPGLRARHVLWARFAGIGRIEELSFAQTWRHGAVGEGASLSGRLDLTSPGFKPCTTLSLCPACRVFGSAQTSGKPVDSGELNYQGHVRIGPMTVAGSTEWVDLPIPGQPRPGAGQMYLVHDSVPQGKSARAEIGAVPLREWGSALDESGNPRPIRGRKLYWRTGSVERRPDRHLWHRSHTQANNPEDTRRRCELIGVGSCLTGTLTFENLTEPDLAAILVALAPARIAAQALPSPSSESDAATYCFTLGGGKPLGLGALVADSVTVKLEGVDRYDGVAAVSANEDSIGGWVSELAKTLPAAAATWPSFLKLCRWNSVNPRIVGYPRDNEWPVADSDTLYQPGFDWWRRSAGMPWDGLASTDKAEQERHTYLTLPLALDEDVSQPIHPEGVAPKAGQGGGHRGH